MPDLMKYFDVPHDANFLKRKRKKSATVTLRYIIRTGILEFIHRLDNNRPSQKLSQTIMYHPDLVYHYSFCFLNFILSSSFQSILHH